MNHVMKKVVLTLLVALCALSCAQAGNPSKVESLVNQYRKSEGFEVFSMGRLGLSLIKVAAVASGELDEEDRAVLAQFNGIRRITIVDFEGASAQVKSAFTGKLEKVLDKMELIMEAKDGGETMRIYGIDKGDKIRDCILYCNDGTLICTHGALDMDKLGELMQMAE